MNNNPTEKETLVYVPVDAKIEKPLESGRYFTITISGIQTSTWFSKFNRWSAKDVKVWYKPVPLSVLVEEKVKELEAKCIKMTKALEDIRDNGTSYSKMKANAVLSDLNANPATKFTNQSTKWPSY